MGSRLRHTIADSCDEKNFTEFFNHLNIIHPKLSAKQERDKENSVTFLDILMIGYPEGTMQ